MDRDEYTYKYGHLYKKVSEEELERELARKLALEKQRKELQRQEWAEYQEWQKEKEAKDLAEEIARLEAEEAARVALRLLEQAQEARQAAIQGGEIVYVLDQTANRFSRPKVSLRHTAVTDALSEEARIQRQETWEKRQQRAEAILRRERALRSVGLHPSHEYRVATMAYGGNDGSYPYGKWVRRKGSSDAQWGDSMIWD
jgi:hypothetical protein